MLDKVFADISSSCQFGDKIRSNSAVLGLAFYSLKVDEINIDLSSHLRVQAFCYGRKGLLVTRCTCCSHCGSYFFKARLNP